MSFLGAIGRGIVGGVRGFVTGGPGGAVSGAVRGALGRPTPVRQATTLPAVVRGGGGPSVPAVVAQQLPMIAPRGLFGGGGRQGPNLPSKFPGAVPEPGFKGALQRFLPGGQSGFTGAPPGYHVNKAYLSYLRATEQGRNVENPFSEPRAVNVVVRNRSMNPLNAKALRRAVTRQRQAVGLMRGVLAGTGWTITRRGLGGKKKRR